MHGLKQAVVARAARAMASAGLYQRLRGDRGVIVSFHRVTDEIPEDALTKGSADFDAFCAFFKAHFDVVPLGDFVGRVRRKESLGGALAITFDDGYLDNHDVAAPILRRHGLPATFFVTTRFIESETVPWWDVGLSPQPRWMSWAQVRSLAAEGFDIGAHTRTHPDLGVLTGSDADDEIAGSRADLIARLGEAPSHFAYPYGRVKNLLEANRERVRNAGFDCCVSSYGGLVVPGDSPYALQRVPIGTWYRTPDQFGFRVVARRV